MANLYAIHHSKHCSQTVVSPMIDILLMNHLARLSESLGYLESEIDLTGTTSVPANSRNMQENHSLCNKRS